MKLGSLLYGIAFLYTSMLTAYSFDAITIFNKDCDNGPNAVVLSLLRGLTYAPIRYNRNPENPADVAPIAVVLSDVENLKQVIAWKRAGYVKYIFAGPNLMHRANDHDHLLAHDEIDIILMPSEWVRTSCIQDDPQLADKIRVWYAGIDEQHWHDSFKRRKNTKNVLVYIKNNENNLADQVVKLLKKYNWEPLIINYGIYSHETYKAALKSCQFAIFLSKSESQGIALAECWAMNVPTLVWDPQELIAHGKRYDPITSCPYLTPQTGIRWKTVDDLKKLLKKIHKKLPSFQPRTWILRHMTDRISTDLLLTIIENTVQTNTQESR